MQGKRELNRRELKGELKREHTESAKACTKESAKASTKESAKASTKESKHLEVIHLEGEVEPCPVGAC